MVKRALSVALLAILLVGSKDCMRTAFRLDSSPINIADSFGFRSVLAAGK